MNDYVAKLPGHLTKHGEDQAKKLNKKFKELDSFIGKKKEDLVAKFCAMKEKAIQPVDVKIEQVKEEVAGPLRGV